MPEVTYDDRSFMVDGKRIWLVSGSIHYFRTPAELWRDRLVKAKRAGLNCISTYVPWNFHEPEEGKWDFSGDRDVASFIRLAGELGLYAIVRPGPYICGEWDFGGLPAWLTSKSGIAYRSNNAAYMHYFDKYFAKALPQLAELQVSRGGNIILIQNENEYMMTTMPDRQAYLDFISQLYRRAGFDIPIINCNLFSTPPLAGSIECANGHTRVVQHLKRLRLRQPDAPLLATEFWVGWFDSWGGQHPGRKRPDRECARKALEILGCGAQYNYYMWHGGTNFGFWASRLTQHAGSYQTTSYDYDAPLAEGGGLTDKYYYTRLVDMLASSMGTFLASCTAERPGVSVHEGLAAFNLAGPTGRWAVISNNGDDEITSARASLPDGTDVTVSLEPLGAMALPIGLQLGPKARLDYANCTPLGLFGEDILVLHGPAGWAAQVSVNGQLIREEIPEDFEPKIIETEGLRIVLLDSELAMRTWWVEDSLIFGPDFIGETAEDIVDRPGAKQYSILTAEGELRKRKVKAGAKAKGALPRLSNWKTAQVCDEPADAKLQWQSISGPHDAGSLGIHYGYLWYRLEITEKRERIRHLFLPDCQDRATVFLNKARIGLWGYGDGADKAPIRATFKRGKNVLTVLADNLGRYCYGQRLGQKKGLYGHIYDAKPLRTGAFKVKRLEGFSRRMVPRPMSHLLERLEQLEVSEAVAEFALTSVAPVHLQFSDLPNHVAVMCNERVAGFFPAAGPLNYGDLKFHAGLKKGRNKVKLILWGDVDRKALQNVRLHTLGQTVSHEAAWSFRPWHMPTDARGASSRRGRRPAWFSARFKHKGQISPLFLQLAGVKKGQVFLNGRNLGRFWSIGPQQCYYLPDCWLGQTNELLIFDEAGRAPTGSRLVVRPGGPYQD